MNGVQEIIAGCIVSLFSFVIGLLAGEKRKVTNEEFERHRTSQNPHIDCAVHGSKMESIEKKLDDMGEKLDCLLLNKPYIERKR